jgi:hypothetical protein
MRRGTDVYDLLWRKAWVIFMAVGYEELHMIGSDMIVT